jgi:hypothetical protein
MSGGVKITLLEMVLWAETEAEGVETWRRVLKAEGKEIDPGVMRRGLIARRASETLELLMRHQAAFVEIVRAARREEAERAADAVTASTAPSSAPSTSTTPASESTAR